MDLIVGTAGHIDHGKTALVRALTGIDTDRLPEEKQRGITVDLGFAELQIGDVHAGFIDVPGHERFVKNMLAGAAGIDLVLLVVAADEGVMPQTREHFEIVRLLGIQRGIVALTKVDLVDEETVELARLDVADLVDGSFMQGSSVMAVSSHTGYGIAELTEAIAAESARLQRPDSYLTTRMPVDRSFSVKGFGTVATGTLASGRVREGDELELLPTGRIVRVRGVQVHGHRVVAAPAFSRTAVNLASLDVSEVSRGMTLSEPGALPATQAVDASIETLNELPKPLRSRQRVRLHIGTSEALARVQVLGPGNEIGPDAEGLIQLRLETPIAAFPGERFIIRTYSPSRTVAGGEVIDPTPVKHRQRDLDAARAFLEKLRSAATLADRLFLLIEHEAGRGITKGELRRRNGVTQPALESAIVELFNRRTVHAVGETLVETAAFERICSDILDRVAAFHKADRISRGIKRVELRDRASRKVSEEVFEGAISHLIGSGRLSSERELILMAERAVEMSPEQILVRDRLQLAFERAGLEPDKVEQIVSAAIADVALSPPDSRKLLQRLLDEGKIVKVSEEYWFSAAAVDDLKGRLKHFAQSSADRSIDMAQFKELSGLSRKYAIPLVEFLDRERFTIRRGDKRMIL